MNASNSFFHTICVARLLSMSTNHSFAARKGTQGRNNNLADRSPNLWRLFNPCTSRPRAQQLISRSIVKVHLDHPLRAAMPQTRTQTKSLVKATPPDPYVSTTFRSADLPNELQYQIWSYAAAVWNENHLGHTDCEIWSFKNKRIFLLRLDVKTHYIDNHNCFNPYFTCLKFHAYSPFDNISGNHVRFDAQLWVGGTSA